MLGDRYCKVCQIKLGSLLGKEEIKTVELRSGTFCRECGDQERKRLRDKKSD